MRSSVAGRGTMILKSLPSLLEEVADESITRNDVLAWMGRYLPVSPTAPPKRIALSLPIGVIV